MVESSSALQNWNVLTNKANEYFGYIGEHKLSETMDWVLWATNETAFFSDIHGNNHAFDAFKKLSAQMNSIS